MILSYEDPVVLAKTFTSFGPLGEKLKLRGAVLDGKALTPAEVQALATLPSREVIFSQLLGLLNAPATQLVRLLNEPGSYLARVIDAIGKKNGAAAPAALRLRLRRNPRPKRRRLRRLRQRRLRADSRILSVACGMRAMITLNDPVD